MTETTTFSVRQIT